MKAEYAFVLLVVSAKCNDARNTENSARSRQLFTYNYLITGYIMCYQEPIVDILIFRIGSANSRTANATLRTVSKTRDRG